MIAMHKLNIFKKIYIDGNLIFIYISVTPLLFGEKSEICTFLWSLELHVGQSIVEGQGGMKILMSASLHDVIVWSNWH